MRYLLVADVAKMLACSQRTVHERSRRLEIPHRKPPGMRQLLFVEAEVRAWLDGAAIEVEQLPRGGRVVKPRPKAT